MGLCRCPPKRLCFRQQISPEGSSKLAAGRRPGLGMCRNISPRGAEDSFAVDLRPSGPRTFAGLVPGLAAGAIFLRAFGANSFTPS